MVDQPELSRVEIGGAERTETSSGGHGRSESTSEERNGYAERNALLVPTVRKGCKYKMIQNGMDEYKWWIEEAIERGEPADPVALDRGGKPLGRKRFFQRQSQSLDFGSNSSSKETVKD